MPVRGQVGHPSTLECVDNASNEVDMGLDVEQQATKEERLFYDEL